MIKRIKVASVWVAEADKEITAGENSKTPGKKYNVCDATIKVADDSNNYAGRSIKMGFFANIEKNRTGKSQADYFKSQNEGKEILLDIKEGKEYLSKKTLQMEKGLEGKTISKAKKEAYEEALKEINNQ